MKYNKEIDKIRALTARWYSGTSTPEEDRELRNLFSSDFSLPPDLEKEREFFEALWESEKDMPAMPSEYAQRISDVLEKEMAESRVGKFDSSAFQSARRRRWMWAAAGVAVCLIGSFITFRMINNPALNVPVNPGIATKTGVHDAADDTIHMQTLKIGPESVSNNIASANDIPEKKLIQKRAKTAKKKRSRHYEAATFEGWDEYDESEREYISSEEAMLASNNYRVVRNEEEAQAIINSVFGRMDSQIAMESGKISIIESEYNSEIDRITNRYNTETSNEQNHEYTPY